DGGGVRQTAIAGVDREYLEAVVRRVDGEELAAVGREREGTDLSALEGDEGGGCGARDKEQTEDEETTSKRRRHVWFPPRSIAVDSTVSSFRASQNPPSRSSECVEVVARCVAPGSIFLQLTAPSARHYTTPCRPRPIAWSRAT